MRILRLIAFCLLTMVTLTPHVLADVSAEERRKAFAWFDTLGYPDVAKLPLVKVSRPNERNRIEYAFGETVIGEYGFLMQADAKQFTVYFLTLVTRDLTLSPRTKQGPGVSFEPLDLKPYVERLLKWQVDRDSQVAIREHQGAAGLFILARACEGNGFSDLAAQLCNMADDNLPIYGKDEHLLSTFQAKLAERIGHEIFLDLRSDFGDRTLPYTALLSQFELLNKRFPKGPDAVETVYIENELRRMVAEEREHAARAALPNGKATLQSRIDALIFDLRTQHGHQYSNPGGCDVFADERGEKSPAAQLRKIGLPAVPALTAALTDTRLTRSVRGMFGDGSTLTIGETAQQILEAIAYRHFPVTYGSKDAAIVYQKEVRRWWEEVQARGEIQVLIEGVRRGDENSAEQARRLAVLKPKSVLPALTEGIQRTDSHWVRQALVSAVGNLYRSDTLPLLKTQLRQGKDLGTRLAAAEALHQHGDPEAVTRMVQEWKRGPQLDKDSLFFTLHHLIRFLVECGAPEAMQALETGLQNRDVGTRSEVVDAFFEAAGDMGEVSPKPSQGQKGQMKTRQAQVFVAQRLLIGLLQDTTVQPSTRAIGGYSFRDPRLCDLANAALAVLWPHTYHYENSASLEERDRERIETANRWKTAHGPTRP